MILKHICSLLTAAVLALGAFGGSSAFAEEPKEEIVAPSGIELYLGTVEINKSDLTEDTVVEVPFSINNNPGFISLAIPAELDTRLSFICDSVTFVVSGLAGVNIHPDLEPVEGCVVFCLEANSGRNNQITANGELIKLKVKIPKDTGAGTYPIVFSQEGKGSLMIFTKNSNDYQFGPEVFSKLVGGAIIVKDDTTVSQTVTSASVQTAKPTVTTKQTTTTPKTTTTTTTVSESETTPEVTESKPSDTTAVTTTTVTSAPVQTPDETEPASAESKSDPAGESDSGDGISIFAIACIAGIVIGVAIVIIVLVHNKKDDDD